MSLVRYLSRQSVVLITPRSVSSVGRLDALAVDTNFAKNAEGWVSSCGDVTFWLELMAPKRQGRKDVISKYTLYIKAKSCQKVTVNINKDI